MSKLRSPEEIKASKLEATAKYLEHAEDVLSELIGQLFGKESERIPMADGAECFRYHAMGVRQLAMALRRYPSFDPACLSGMKKFTYVRRVGSHDISIEVMVPTFGIHQIGYGRICEFNLFSDQNVFEFGRGRVLFNQDLQRENRDALQAKDLHRSGEWTAGRISAAVPTIPKDVDRRIDEARQCFDHMSLVWEAEWSSKPVEDPLVIGHVLDQHFLVDQYDVTKLERYISSEMTRRPLK
jgi:hypothetical protein